MFLFAFLFSILIQYFYTRNETRFIEKSLRYGMYFFLAIGLIYLGLIGVEFAKTYSQIYLSTGAWLMLTLGILFSYGARAYKSESTQKGTKLSYFFYPAVAASALFFIMTSIFLTESFLIIQLKSLQLYTTVAVLGILSVVGFISLLKDIIGLTHADENSNYKRLIHKMKKRKKLFILGVILFCLLLGVVIIYPNVIQWLTSLYQTLLKFFFDIPRWKV